LRSYEKELPERRSLHRLVVLNLILQHLVFEEFSWKTYTLQQGKSTPRATFTCKAVEETGVTILKRIPSKESK
jgi:hypothetical protein